MLPYKNIRTVIGRVEQMEIQYDKLSNAVKNAPELLDTEEMQDAYHELSEYMESGNWLYDYEMDEDGLLPEDLKRGVLSQDGLYDLLSEME